MPKNGPRGAGNDLGKLLPFYIILALRELSSKDHMVIAPDILRWLEQFKAQDDALKLPSRTTIDASLSMLASHQFFDPDNKEFPNMPGFGYSINEVEGTNPNGTTKKMYYLESDLERDQVFLIMDALEAYAYMDNRNTQILIRYFSKLYPQARRSYRENNPEKADCSHMPNNVLSENIAEFKMLIDKGAYARIWNCHYGVKYDKKGGKYVPALFPRRPEGQLIKPLDLLWNNGSYYLIAGMQRRSTTSIPLTHFRLDRIGDIEDILPGENQEEYRECEKIFRRTPHYDPVAYQKKHPQMFSGDMKKVKLLCHITPRNGMMNSLIDAFGFHPSEITIPDDQTLKAYLGNKADRILATTPNFSQDPKSPDCWITISYDSSDEGAVQFVLEHSADCRVLYPQNVSDEIVSIMSRATLLNSW